MTTVFTTMSGTAEVNMKQHMKTPFHPSLEDQILICHIVYYFNMNVLYQNYHQPSTYNNLFAFASTSEANAL